MPTDFILHALSMGARYSVGRRARQVAPNEKHNRLFPQGRPDDPSFGLLQEWWKDLEKDKGERAYLRRAESLTQVMLSPAFVALLRSLRNQGYVVGGQDTPLAKIAAIVGLAARVKSLTVEDIAIRMGTPKPGSTTAPLSELRLRRILACDDLEELYTLLRRVLSILDDTVNLSDLATTVWNWSPLDAKQPYDPRRRLAYDYYSALPTKP